MFGIQRRIEGVEESVRVSFENARSDVANLFKWITYLNAYYGYMHGELARLRQSVEVMQQHVSSLPKADIAPVVSRISSMEQAMAKLNLSHSAVIESHQKISNSHSQLVNSYNSLSQSHNALLSSHNELKSEHYELKKAHIEHKSLFEELSRKLSSAPKLIEKSVEKRIETPVSRVLPSFPVFRDSERGQLRSMVLNMVRTKGTITGTELKRAIVDSGICSKSSFYRLLEQLEQEGSVSSQPGRQKIFVNSSSKNPISN